MTTFGSDSNLLPSLPTLYRGRTFLQNMLLVTGCFLFVIQMDIALIFIFAVLGWKLIKRAKAECETWQFCFYTSLSVSVTLRSFPIDIQLLPGFPFTEACSMLIVSNLVGLTGHAGNAYYCERKFFKLALAAVAGVLLLVLLAMIVSDLYTGVITKWHALSI